MVDVVTPEVRSRMMSLIRNRNTKPEQVVRRGLWAKGFRYRLHGRNLPGRPDLVLSKWRTVVFVNGCFWHAHEGCRYFRVPSSRPDFWKAKLSANRERDSAVIARLQQRGWNVVTVWECALRLDPAAAVDEVATQIQEGGTGSRHVEVRALMPTTGSNHDQLSRFGTESPGTNSTISSIRHPK